MPNLRAILPGTFVARLLLAACSITWLGSTAEAAKPVKYTSYVAGATAFRDSKIRNGSPDPGEPTTETGEDGNFQMAKGKGRLYLTGGTDIRTGQPNRTLLTTPPASKGLGTLSALWQALLDRGKKPKQIRVLLNVPAKISLADNAAVPVAGRNGVQKPRLKTQTLVKKDAQHNTLVQFLKSLVRRPGLGAKAHVPRAGSALPPEDEDIGALATYLATQSGPPLDPSEFSSVRDAVGTLRGSELPAVQLDFLAAGIGTLNQSIDQLDANSPPAEQEAIEALLKEETTALETAFNSGVYEEFNNKAFPPPLITGFSQDTGSSDHDFITSDTTPTLSGTVNRAATKVRIYSVDPADPTGDTRTKLADVDPDADGNWSYTVDPPLTSGTYGFGVSGVIETASGFESGLRTIPDAAAQLPAVQIDTSIPQDASLTVTPLTTDIRTPLLSGTWDPALGNTLTVTVAGVEYGSATGLDLSQGNTWRLLIPQSRQLADGTHDVTATLRNVAGNSVSDTTSGELIIAPVAGHSFGAGVIPRAITFGRFTASAGGQPDLAVASQEGNSVAVLRSNGNGGFQTAAVYPAGSAPVGVAAADLDGDQDVDLVTANFGGGNVTVLLNDGNGGFPSQGAPGYPAGTKPAAIAVGFFNGDALPDVAVADAGGDRLAILLNNGSGGFSAPVFYPADSFPYGVAVADVDGDEREDVVLVNRNGNSVSVFRGNGDGSFQAKIDHPVGSEPAALALADLDGDGTPDLAVAQGCCAVSVSLGKGDGSFQPAVSHPTGNYPYAVAIGDVNGDGRNDVVAANWGSDSVSMLLGNGSGGFSSSLAYAAGAKPVALSLADSNGDGAADAAVANYSAATVYLLPGQPLVLPATAP